MTKFTLRSDSEWDVESSSEWTINTVRKLLDEDGGWTWFQHPRAIRVGSKTITGAQYPSGGVWLWSYDHNTDATDFNVIDSVEEIGDHNPPTILPRQSDNRLVVVWGYRTGADPKYRISTNPLDITDFGPTQSLAVTNTMSYPKVAQLSDESGRIYLTYRSQENSYGDRERRQYSDDGGQTWQAEEVLFSFPDDFTYGRLETNGVDTIYHAANPKDGGNDEPGKAIYYVEYRDGTFYSVDGAVVGTDADLPLTESDLPLVTDTDYPWIWDMAMDTNERPHIVYSAYPEYDAGNLGVHDYRYARWTGSSWDVQTLATDTGQLGDPSVEPLYSGGIALDHDDPTVAYYAEENANGDFELYRATTDDGGASWDRENLTPQTGEDNVRPLAVNGGSGVFWMQGYYQEGGDYDTQIQLNGVQS